MLERVVSGVMSVLMALSPAAGDADAAPETAVELQAEVSADESARFSNALTLDSVRALTFADSPQDAADAISYAASIGLMSGYEDGLFRPDAFLNAGQAIRILRRVAARSGLDSGPASQSDLDWASAVELLSMEGDDFRLTYRPRVSQLLVEHADGSQERIVLRNEELAPSPESQEWVLVRDAESAPSPESQEWVLVRDAESADLTQAWIVRDGEMELLTEYANGASESVTLRAASDLTRAQFALLLYRFAAFAGYDLSCTGNLSLRPDGDSVPSYARIPYSWAMEHDIYRTIVVDNLCPNLPVSRAQAALLFTALLADGTGEPVAESITQAARNPFFISKSRDLHAQIQEAVDAAGQRYGATGLQVAVIERGRLTDTYAYGWATRGSDRMTAVHKMRIASISKVLIGMTAARMRQDGLIDYDAPLGIYWDATFQNPAHPNTPVTIHTLLTHTSSLADGSLAASSVRYRLSTGRGYTSAVPGSLDYWEYSNFGFGVLGLTLERVGDRTMDQLLDRYFFDLMGIDGAFYAGDLKDSSQLVTLYSGGSVTRSAESQRSRHNSGVPCTDGSVFAGGLVISVRDLGKMAALLANDGVYEGLRVLDADSVRVMETYANQKTPDGFYQGMPIRYRTDAYGRAGIYYHTGSAYGVFNGFSYDPETGDGVVVLSDGASGARDSNGNYAVCGAIFDAVYHAIAS